LADGRTSDSPISHFQTILYVPLIGDFKRNLKSVY